MGEERLPRRVIFGEMVGGKVYRHFFGQEMDLMGRLEEGLKEFGIKSEGSGEAAQHRRPEDSVDGSRTGLRPFSAIA